MSNRSFTSQNVETQQHSTQTESVKGVKGVTPAARAWLHEDLEKSFLRLADQNPLNADLSDREREEMRAAIKEDVATLFRNR